MEDGFQERDEHSEGDGPPAGFISGEIGAPTNVPALASVERPDSVVPGESSAGEVPTRTRRDDWLILHQAVLAGDKVAQSLVAEVYMEYVKRVLKSLRPEVDDELLTDATTDAIMNYVRHPERFDPSKRSLASYLVMSAKGDLLNELEKRNNRRRREILDYDGELKPNGRNDPIEGNDTELWDEIRRNFSARDFTAVRMILGGVKSYAEYARIWNIDSSDPLEMRREVKRRKTQIKRKLARIYRKWKESSDA